MSRQFSETSEQLLKKMASDRLNEMRSDANKKYLHQSGKLFTVCLVFAWISAIYNAVIFLAQYIGFQLNAMDNTIYVPDARNAGICCLLLVAATVCLIFKKYTPSSVLSLAFAAFYFVNSTFRSTAIVGEKARIAMFVPAIIILALTSVYMLITVITDKIAFRRSYNRLIDKIVATYPTSPDEVTTAEQWDRYIKEYSLPAVHEKPKKSLRRKAEKSNTDDETKG